MLFGKKTQVELDAAFLEAIGQHHFKKAKKLLKAGASVQARDAAGNGAFHALASADKYMTKEEISDFICVLLAAGADIHARNNEAQTCLHRIAEKSHESYGFNKSVFHAIGSLGVPFDYRCSGETLLHILLNRGARLGDRDNAGRIPAHIAAARGDQDMTFACLVNPALVAVQDNDGKYPHDSAISGPVQHNILSLQLQSRLKAHQNPEAEKAKTASASDEWALLEADQVAHITVRKAIGYKLTEIFNFTQRTYVRITHNLETKADVSETKGFDEFADKTAFVRARAELLRLGGTADEAAIHGQKLDKSRNILGKDA